jgi:hypothetical protein
VHWYLGEEVTTFEHHRAITKETKKATSFSIRDIKEAAPQSHSKSISRAQKNKSVPTKNSIMFSDCRVESKQCFLLVSVGPPTTIPKRLVEISLNFDGTRFF